MFDRIKILDLPTDCDAYKSSIHHVDENNNVTHLFNYWDRIEQEEFLLNNYNRRNKQGLLFLQ